jgi:hypothetical protein
VLKIVNVVPQPAPIDVTTAKVPQILDADE